MHGAIEGCRRAKLKFGEKQAMMRVIVGSVPLTVTSDEGGEVSGTESTTPMRSVASLSSRFLEIRSGR